MEPKELDPASVKPESLRSHFERPSGEASVCWNFLSTAQPEGSLGSWDSRLRLVGRPALRRVLVFTNFLPFSLKDLRDGSQ